MATILNQAAPRLSVEWTFLDNNCYATATADIFGARMHLEAFRMSDALPTRHMRTAGYWSYAGKDEDMVDNLLRHTTEADLRDGKYSPAYIEGMPHESVWLLFAEPAGVGNV